MIHEAFHVARSGRPGPVVVDIPHGPLARGHPLRSRSPTCTCPATSPRPRATRSRSARPPRRSRPRAGPVIYAGGGVIIADASSRAHASSSARAASRSPARSWASARSPRPHPQWLGMLGMHGTRAANYAMDEADLICRGRRPLRRPHHRQAVGVRAAGEVHPHRRRPGRDLQEHPGAHPDRGRRAQRPREAHRRVPRAGGRPRPPRGVVGAHPRLAGASTRCGYEDSAGHRDQAAVRDPGALRGDRRRRDRRRPTSASTRCGRRSTSTSTGRAAGSTPAASGRWASACRRRWARRSAAPTRPSSASPATARSR